MIIAFVVDQYSQGNNGTTMTVRRYAELLTEYGHEVRIICGKGSGNEKIYETGEIHYLAFKNIIHKQGMIFAKYNKKIVYEAIKDCDIVHFILPFGLGKNTKKLCDKLGIPTSAAFHCQPQNISSTAHLGKSKLVNSLIFRRFRRFYNKFDYVHCPSNMIKDELIRHKYKSNLCVISNGITDFFHKIEAKRPDFLKDKICILMTGRYSIEKRQDLIIKAVLNSKYEKDIQLILCGQGPRYKYLRKISKPLTNEVMFGFHQAEELRYILSYSDIYIHSSDAEIEGMACTEAFACGLVPIISNSKKSATNQFALTNESLFKAGDYLDLRDKIDYLIENKERREELSKLYIESSRKYIIDNCVKEFEKMLCLSIEKAKSKK